jgi:hypothetical protein
MIRPTVPKEVIRDIEAHEPLVRLVPGHEVPRSRWRTWDAREIQPRDMDGSAARFVVGDKSV